MNDYKTIRIGSTVPRLHLEGKLDLTYRCNNNCRHCWIRIPPNAEEMKREMTLGEVTDIIGQARAMGCRRWVISGGEPMLRPDFPEIFDLITSNTQSYSLNTNGTLITPEIAELMKRKGTKMVALYGADQEINDHITRNPGSFEATMKGFDLLKEAGAGFIVQIIPLKENYHQFDDMVRLAHSLSDHVRVGASWLYLSACGDDTVNSEIRRQRLNAAEVVRIDKPIMSVDGESNAGGKYSPVERGDDIFAPCITGKNEFHVDPYATMSFCGFIVDPALRYDLRNGSIREGWEVFLPSLIKKVKGGDEYRQQCGSCEVRSECRWCPAYGYLEHGRYSAKVNYLCDVTKELRSYKDEWRKDNRRYFRSGGIDFRIESDLPITDTTFLSTIRQFEIQDPGPDQVILHHRFFLPDIHDRDLGNEVYRSSPWVIYEKDDSWTYIGLLPECESDTPFFIGTFNKDHTRGTTYNDSEKRFLEGDVNSISLFPTDQLLLARLLADREGCYFHSSAVVMNGNGLLFVGHSEAGKSTMVNMLADKVEILCDDRNIIRRNPDGMKGYRVYGTWSHGDVPDVSPNSAPLRAILLLEQAPENRLVEEKNRVRIIKILLGCLIKPLVTADWWDKMLTLAEHISREVPCYNIRFDKSGGIVEVLEKFVQGED